MGLPDWLVKAGARLEPLGVADYVQLYFGDKLVESRGMDELITGRGVIPTVYQVRSCERDENGHIVKSSFEGGLDLVTSKQLVWMKGMYFDTFQEAFNHFDKNHVEWRSYKDDFYIDEDHFNLCRYGDRYNDAGEYTGQVLISEPSVIELLD
jgi:hypothetical protein